MATLRSFNQPFRCSDVFDVEPICRKPSGITTAAATDIDGRGGSENLSHRGLQVRRYGLLFFPLFGKSAYVGVVSPYGFLIHKVAYSGAHPFPKLGKHAYWRIPFGDTLLRSR